MFGFLTYLPTVIFMPHSVFLLILLAYLVFHHKEIIQAYKDRFTGERIKVNGNFVFILLILLCSMVNRFFHSDHVEGIEDFVPYFLLIPLTYLAAIKFRRIDVKVLVGLVFVESIILIIQNLMGVSTFFTASENYYEFGDTDLLYFKHSMGLSFNSSSAAAKILLAFILMDYARLKYRFQLLVKGIMLIALVMTFNRTTMIAMVVYLALYYGAQLKPLRFKLYKVILVAIFGTIGMVVMGYLVYRFQDAIIDQFTRKQGKIELSGRENIWQDYIGFILENPTFGNGSFKLMFGKYHAHNSFIQLIATNGLLIAGLYFLQIAMNLRMSNLIYVFTILLYSVTQYGIFWGISITDIIMYVLLFNKHILPVAEAEDPPSEEQLELTGAPAV